MNSGAASLNFHHPFPRIKPIHSWNIVFTGRACNDGHSLRIGCVGECSDNTIITVSIELYTVRDSQNDVYLNEIAYDTTTSVLGLTYRDITDSSIIKYRIVTE